MNFLNLLGIFLILRWTPAILPSSPGGPISCFSSLSVIYPPHIRSTAAGRALGLGGVGAIVQPKELFLVAAVPLFAVTVLMRSSGNYRAASEAGRSANGLSDDQEQT
jgi:hypothetical protein